MNLNNRIYDENFPLDTTIIKDIPSSIRKKGKMIVDLISNLENVRVTDSLKKIDDNYPEIKFAFLIGDQETNSGFYIKNDDYWFGISELNAIPTLTEANERITFNNNSYQLKTIDDTKIIALSNYFKPVLFYDFFTVVGEEEQEILNTGLDVPERKLKISNVIPNSNLPFVQTNDISIIRTMSPYNVKDSFTFSATFNKITSLSNIYVKKDNAYSVLMFAKDELNSIQCAITYDKDNELYWMEKGEATKLNFQISLDNIYQMSIKMLNEKFTVMINDKEIFSKTIAQSKDKSYIFSVCEDMNSRLYSNGVAEVGEIQIFDKALTPEENSWNRMYPRTWTFSNKNSYLDLSIEEKIKLKELLKK